MSFIKKGKTIAVLLILLEVIVSGGLYAQTHKITKIKWDNQMTEVVSDEICVKVKGGINTDEFMNKMKSLGIEVLNTPDNMGIARLKISLTDEIITTINNLKTQGVVETANPIVITHTSVVPNDSYYSTQWGLPKINASSAWDINTGNPTILIGILDSGIPIQDNTLSHPDINNVNRIIKGKDCISGETDGVKDLNGHGTHVAGIISAESNNNTGISGINWNSKIYIGQVFDSLGSGNSYSFYQGVKDAVDKGAKVINFSGGAMSSVNDFVQAIIYAKNHNCLIVAAAGNYKESNPNGIVEWPAAYSVNYDNVIAVSATNSNDIIADFSCRGPEVTVSAPGDNIYSTLPNYPNKHSTQNYGSLNGTSMAAPFVTGLAGIIFSRYPSLTPAQVREIIKQSADDLGDTGFDNLYGYGRINAYKAVTSFYVPEVFSTIKAALNTAISGQTVYVSGSQSLSENVTVPNGVILSIKPSSAINLNGYSILLNGGSVVVQTGGALNGLAAYIKSGTTLKGYSGSVQNAINTAVANQTVELLAKTYSGNLSITGKSYITLTGQSASATKLQNSISITNSNYTTIKNLTCQEEASISITGGTRTTVSNIINSSITMLYDNGGTSTVISHVSGYMDGASEAVVSHGGAGDVYLSTFENFERAIRVENSGASYIISDNNFCGNGYDIYVANGGYAYANNNKLSKTPPQSFYGNVAYASYTVCGQTLAKTAAQESGIAIADDGYYPEELKVIDAKFLPLFMHNADEEDGFSGKVNAVLDEYKEFVSKATTAKDYSFALQKIKHGYKAIGAENEFYNYIAELETGNKNESVKPVLTKSKMWQYVNAGDYEKAVNAADKVLSSSSDDNDLLAEALYDKGIILRDYMDDKEGADSAFAELVKNFPNSSLKDFALAQLNAAGLSKSAADSATTVMEEISSNMEAGNYPNPFNPTTIIRYSIPEAGNISLKVYDILGREVAHLVDEFQEKGTHSVEFNGSSLSSGIYFYELRNGANVVVKKMLMMK